MYNKEKKKNRKNELYNKLIFFPKNFWFLKLILFWIQVLDLCNDTNYQIIKIIHMNFSGFLMN